MTFQGLSGPNARLTLLDEGSYTLVGAVGFPVLIRAVAFSCLGLVMGGRRRAWGREPRGRAGVCLANFSSRGSIVIIVAVRGANAENSKQVGLVKMLMDIVREATACLVKHPQ
jgi:hypothetical protein